MYCLPPAGVLEAEMTLIPHSWPGSMRAPRQTVQPSAGRGYLRTATRNDRALGVLLWTVLFALLLGLSQSP